MVRKIENRGNLEICKYPIRYCDIFYFRRRFLFCYIPQFFYFRIFRGRPPIRELKVFRLDSLQKGDGGGGGGGGGGIFPLVCIAPDPPGRAAVPTIFKKISF